MTQGEKPPQVLRFGLFEVHRPSGELWKQGLKVRLQEKPFQILLLLLERAGEVVTRDELRERLWTADTFVDFDRNLNKGITKLREALNDTANAPRYVETIPRRGYRFIMPVEAVNGSSSPSARSGTRIRAAWIAGFISAGLVGMWFGLNIFQKDTGLSGRVASREIASIAVLPLKNLSANSEQDFFADALTEQLITELSMIRELRVISRQSVMHFKNSEKSVPEIAKALKVDAILEGSVQREGSRVRINAQLIGLFPERHLWAGNFDRPITDLLELQSEIARAVAREIRITLTPEEESRLSNTRPVNPEAFELYLRGRYHWNQRNPKDLQKGLEYFEQALVKDPNYALAWLGLAESYVLMGSYEILPDREAFPKAKEAALKALEFDETLSEAYATLAAIKDDFEWDLRGAETAYKHAIQLNPSYATARQWYAESLSCWGRTDEALEQIRRAKEVSPMTPIVHAVESKILVQGRKYDQAIRQAQEVIGKWPDLPVTHFSLAEAYEQKGMYKEALAEWQVWLTLTGKPGEKVMALRVAFEESGMSGVYHQLYLEDSGEDEKPFIRAIVHTLSDDADQAFLWLEKAYKEHDPDFLCLPGTPSLDSLRPDPRFQNLLLRLNFPEN